MTAPVCEPYHLVVTGKVVSAERVEEFGTISVKAVVKTQDGETINVQAQFAQEALLEAFWRNIDFRMDGYMYPDGLFLNSMSGIVR